MANSNGKTDYGTKILLIGFTLTTIGGSFLFLKDIVDNVLIHKIIGNVGYFIAMIGFVLCGVGMIRHWIEFFRKIKNRQI